jgi:hypothetical protein
VAVLVREGGERSIGNKQQLLRKRRFCTSRLRKPTQQDVALLEAFADWSWHAPDQAWETGYSALRRFIAREGNANVPRKHAEDGYRLGQWVAVQRSFWRQGRLSNERVSRLEPLPGWTWDTRDAAWERGFSMLERFAEREGHTRVPSGHIEESYNLGRWVVKQRGAVDQLTAERVAQLEALPGWTWDTREATWKEGFSRLKTFAAREGHSRVPTNMLRTATRSGSGLHGAATGRRASRPTRSPS